MFALIVYTQEQKNTAFFIFIAVCFITGVAVELIGTSTGWLFGEYNYGAPLGPGIRQVPFIIGVNWFIIIYCCGVAMDTLINRLVAKLSEQTGQSAKKIQALSIVIDGAMLAVFFDWIMEPVAVKLGYWQWLGDGSIPLYNYICWFVVSILLLYCFHRFQFLKQNKFAVNLLLIQAMFFLLLRTFL
jgi:bisanhydrobacterioruberin hydratase